MPIVKTEAGQQVLKDRSVPLSQRQRAAFILFDGKKTVDDVLKATGAVGVTRADIDRLFELALLADTAGAPAATVTAPRTGQGGEPPTQTGAQERYAAAYPLAIKLTSSLGLRGFRLNLAVEAASSYEELLAVAPKIRDAVGPERYASLGQVLEG